MDIERKKLRADLLVHAVNAQEKDLDLISENKVSVAICPRANGYLRAGFPPILEFLNHKISLCLGTDNVMVNSPDLFREMEFLFKFTRGNYNHSIGLLSTSDLLSMVTINPARALRLDHLTGSLDAGKYSDFFIIDLNSPNLIPLENIHDGIVLRAKSQNVLYTYVKGKRAYERH